MVVVGGLMHYEELKPYAPLLGGMRGNGRAVLMSTDAGATWTDVTGDVGGESMHPDQHAIAFVPGDPDKFFVGSDGGLIRTSGQWADASEPVRQPRTVAGIPSWIATTWLSADPDRVAGSQFRPRHAADVQHRGEPVALRIAPWRVHRTTARSSSSGKPSWYLPLTGDGGDAGFDAVDPNLCLSTYFVGQMDVNYNRADPTSWLWIGDRFIVGFTESIRFYTPTISDPLQTKTIYVGAQRVWRTDDRPAATATFLENPLQHRGRRVPERPALHRRLRRRRGVAAARQRHADRGHVWDDQDGEQYPPRSRARRTPARCGSARAAVAS